MSIADGARALIVDHGSGVFKVGYSGNKEPQVMFPSLHGSIKYPSSIASSGKSLKGPFIGTFAEENRALLDLTYPIERGEILDTGKMEEMWIHMFTGINKFNVVMNHQPMLVVEPVMPSKKTRDRVLEFFFETLNVPAMAFMQSPVLCMYGNGFVTGCCLDSGDTISSVACLSKDLALSHASRRSNIGGRDVTDFLKMCLYKEGLNFPRTFSFQVVKNIKESVCEASRVQFGSEHGHNETTSVSYRLPDGKVIDVKESRFTAPEILFKPFLIGEECLGLHELIHSCIQSVDVELRSDILKNIIVCGGNTLLPGIESRILHELLVLINESKIKGPHIKLFVPKDRAYSAWKGGSMIASLSSFSGMWMQKSQYTHDGRHKY